MFIVAVQWGGNQGGTLTLMFQSVERAEFCYLLLVARDRGENDFEFEVEDDFGTKATINRDEVRGIVRQDLARVYDGQEEVQMMAALANAALQKRQAAEPKLRVMQLSGAPLGMPPGFRA